MSVEFVKDDYKYLGIYRGGVLDTNDPNRRGRIKVNVFGLYDNISPVHLPWATPMQPVWTGAGAGYGMFSVPEVGSLVFVQFEGGDIYQPIVIGLAPDAVHGLPSERTTNYPNRRIMKTKAGIVIFIDDADKKIRITHPTGKYIEMDSGGNITVSAADITIDSDDITINAADIDVTGENITITGTRIEMNP